MFQNRSGYGPFQINWFKEYINQFEKFKTTAICGSTINFNDHNDRSNSTNLPHIQTYSFLTTINHLKMFGDKFPGEDKTTKFEIICEGEIGFSQFFLKKNHTITCMEWPENEISNISHPISIIDIKANVTKKHYFYHREYFKKNKIKNFIRKIKNLRSIIKFLYKGIFSK